MQQPIKLPGTITTLLLPNYICITITIALASPQSYTKSQTSVLQILPSATIKLLQAPTKFQDHRGDTKYWDRETEGGADVKMVIQLNLLQKYSERWIWIMSL